MNKLYYKSHEASFLKFSHIYILCNTNNKTYTDKFETAATVVVL